MLLRRLSTARSLEVKRHFAASCRCSALRLSSQGFLARTYLLTEPEIGLKYGLHSGLIYFTLKLPEHVPGCLSSSVFVSRLEVELELIELDDARRCLFVAFAKCAPDDDFMKRAMNRSTAVDHLIDSYDHSMQNRGSGLLF